VHEVLRTPAGADYLKLFVGFRVTATSTPLLPGNTAATFEGMGVPFLKSGDRPRLYSRMHRACFQRKSFKAVARRRKSDAHAEVVVKGGLEGFSRRFLPKMRTVPLVGGSGGGGGGSGGGGHLVPAICPSLADLGLGGTLRAYSAGELEVGLGVPKRAWGAVWGVQGDGKWAEGPFAL
jgi:hypothetical protein